MQKPTGMFFEAVAIDYTRTEPCVIRENARWAVVYKPPHLPTAPLREDERNTLVYWFLHRTEAVENNLSAAAQVCGKKSIEAGLLHRLDTETRGLVLFAKDQTTYDFLADRQEAGQIIKTYCAFVEPNRATETDNGYGFAVTDLSTIKALPYTLISQFRNFGPGAKKVAPVFPGSRHYKKDGRLYTTVIDAVDILPFFSPIDESDTLLQTACGHSSFKTDFGHTSYPSSIDEQYALFQNDEESAMIRIRCCLSRGYRHQVRAHLASAGIPIVGDSLYAPQGSKAAQGSLQLYAVNLEFPDPENHRRNICVALLLPDRMNP